MVVRAIIWALVREVRDRLGPSPKAEEVKEKVCEGLGLDGPGRRGRRPKNEEVAI